MRSSDQREWMFLLTHYHSGKGRGRRCKTQADYKQESNCDQMCKLYRMVSIQIVNNFFLSCKKNSRTMPRRGGRRAGGHRHRAHHRVHHHHHHGIRHHHHHGIGHHHHGIHHHHHGIGHHHGIHHYHHRPLFRFGLFGRRRRRHHVGLATGVVLGATAAAAAASENLMPAYI